MGKTLIKPKWGELKNLHQIHKDMVEDYNKELSVNKIKTLCYHTWYRRYKGDGRNGRRQTNAEILEKEITTTIHRNLLKPSYAYNYISRTIDGYINNVDEFMKCYNKSTSYATLNYPIKNGIIEYCYYLVKTPNAPYSYSGFMQLKRKMGKNVDEMIGIKSDRAEGTFRKWYKEDYLINRKYKDEKPYSYTALISCSYDGISREEMKQKSKKGNMLRRNTRKPAEIPKRMIDMVRGQLALGNRKSDIMRSIGINNYQLNKIIKNITNK